ncbi:MAG TPA: hypothetical protein VGO50_03105 [Pyrinomonadaceae bacterium]|jgi:hypothetical protein|nr:hypothetical protein [Pyrinomonadaceae bacterium]
MKFFSSILVPGTGIFLLTISLCAQQLPKDEPSRGNAVARPGRDGKRVVRPDNTDPTADELDRAIEGDERPVSRLNKIVKDKLKITDGERAGYKKSLEDSKANITRLLSAFSCSTALVVDLSDPRCTDDAYLFEGSYYSFRYKGYGQSSWTDLSLIEGEFTAGNKWNTVGFIIDLGKKADFNRLDENAKEIRDLWELPSAETLAEKKEQRENLEKGFALEDVFVSSKAKFQIDHVYLLRTTTYRVEGGMAMFRSAFNWYNTDSLFVLKAMDFDGRRTATIGWKRLLQRVAPLLKDKEKEKEKTREG